MVLALMSCIAPSDGQMLKHEMSWCCPEHQAQSWSPVETQVGLGEMSRLSCCVMWRASLSSPVRSLVGGQWAQYLIL